jgi:hypothetical protein
MGREVAFRYIAFLFLGCTFTLGVVEMVKTHRQVSSPPPQVVAVQIAH